MLFFFILLLVSQADAREGPYLPLSEHTYFYYYYTTDVKLGDAVLLPKDEMIHHLSFCSIIASNRFLQSQHSSDMLAYGNLALWAWKVYNESTLGLEEINMYETTYSLSTEKGKWELYTYNNYVTLKLDSNGAFHLKCDDMAIKSISPHLRTPSVFVQLLNRCDTVIGVINLICICMCGIVLFISYLCCKYDEDEVELVIDTVEPMPTFDVVEIDRAITCCICWSEARNLLYLPCRHVITCEKCGKENTKCPVCHAVIKKILSVYLS